jgi:chemotaxis protein MotB
MTPEQTRYSHEPAVTGRAWMITFTDLASLLLAFFVLLFSMSSVRMDSWQVAIDSLSRTLNPTRVDKVVPSAVPFNIGTTYPKRGSDLDYLATVLKEAMREDALLSNTRIMRLADRLIVALPGDLLFEKGRAELSERADKSLLILGSVLRNIGNRIGVNGHSDPEPLNAGAYKSNWELSLARAVTVSNALRHAGYGREIVAYGFADSRYQQLPKIEEERRRALARRVDIVILPTETPS